MSLDKYLAEVKSRADKATPGPWDARCKEFSNSEIPRHIWSNYGWLATFNGPRMRCLADTEFTANAIEDIPRLLRIIEVLRDGLEFYASGGSHDQDERAAQEYLNEADNLAGSEK